MFTFDWRLILLHVERNGIIRRKEVEELTVQTLDSAERGITKRFFGDDGRGFARARLVYILFVDREDETPDQLELVSEFVELARGEGNFFLADVRTEIGQMYARQCGVQLAPALFIGFIMPYPGVGPPGCFSARLTGGGAVHPETWTRGEREIREQLRRIRSDQSSRGMI